MGERDWRPFVYGGVSSCLAEFGTFPIDLTKARLQIQGQKFDQKHSDLKYRGMTHCFLTVFREEGITALYSGIVPALVRQATYGTIKFGTYYSLKKKIIHTYKIEETVGLNVLCAVVAGAVSSAIANPTDVLKVRMQIGDAHKNLGMIDSVKDIYKNEGLRGLWRGVGPTAQRAVVVAAVELPVYDYTKSKLLNEFGDNISNHFISSFVASFWSAVASNPIDVLRTRLMNQRRLKKTDPSHQKFVYKGTIDCFIKTFRNEGVLAFYKGFIPTWVRMGPWNIIFFITYEQLKKLY